MAEKDIIIEEKTTEEKNTAEIKEEVKEETPLEDVVLETEGGTKSLLGATSETGDIAATSLDTKTTPAGTDNLILFNQNTNVGYQIDYDNLADAILGKITSKTYANQVGGSSAATLLAQLSTLNSNFVTHQNISAGYTGQLTGRSSRGVLWLLSTDPQRAGMYFFVASSSGTTIYLIPILEPTQYITVTSTAGVVSIKNETASDYAFLYMTTLEGDPLNYQAVANT